MPENVQRETNYPFVMFCVVYAKESPLLPPTVNYGK